MTPDYSLKALLEFADYLADKGLLNKNTAVSRKAACSKIFGILGDEETKDLRNIDVDEVAMRFNNLEGGKYSPDSLRVYKSRANAALTDFFRYKKNPATFRIEKTAKSNKSNNNTASKKQPDNKFDQSPDANFGQMHARETPNSVDFPIPLRENVIVYLNGLPVDLKASEAKKICSVVTAMASADLE